ncbi:MAG TPA: NAD(P)/FAD-dependent oxidoreductase [Gammaproteobacteria bacterium]|nr:NAD(P)/FAD-dependent oxidoreductase [Gammaproteobacteria bacterium]
MKTEHCDVLVIGAGPSGSISAAILQRAGLEVRVVERERFPRFMIGESLLPKTMEHLDDAGLFEAANAFGFQVKNGARFIRDGAECMIDFSDCFTPGWTWTWQLPRADFDKLLADEVAKRGVRFDYETSVTGVAFDGRDSITTVKNAAGDESEIGARFLIDASGYGRVLPKALDLVLPSDQPPRSAFFAQVADSARPAGNEGTQITFMVPRQDAWFWVIPFSNGATSLGFTGSAGFFEGFANKDEAAFRRAVREDPHYGERFEGVEYVMAPRFIKAYASAVKRLCGPGYAITGNSAEFLDPIFSSGVAFATGSGALAAKLAIRELAGETVDWEREYSEHMRSGVRVFRHYVDAWYDGSLQDIFFAPDFNDDIRRQICSVLAGYVWDANNPFVARYDRATRAVVNVIRARRPADG